MKGTQKRKYIHAVQLTTSNKTLPGGVCKSPLYWKSKIRGRRGVVSCLFFTPFPRTPASGHRDSGMSRSQGETSTPRFSLNSEWLHVALCKIPAQHGKVLIIKYLRAVSREVPKILRDWFLSTQWHYRSQCLWTHIAALLTCMRSTVLSASSSHCAASWFVSGGEISVGENTCFLPISFPMTALVLQWRSWWREDRQTDSQANESRQTFEDRLNNKIISI